MTCALCPAPRRMTVRAAIDMTGAVVGDLRVERESHRDRGVWWECTCLGCGDTVVRSGISLRRAQDLGYASACAECRRQVRAAIAATRPRHYLRDMFRRIGALYGSNGPDGIPECFTARNRGAYALDDGEPYSGQKALGFAEIAQADGGYVCAQCRHVTTDTVGCLDCVEPVCRACADEHDCIGPMTRKAIADVFNYSRERVRQWELSGLEKMRKALAR